MPQSDLQQILRDYLRCALESDLEQHMQAPPGKAVYASQVDEHDDPILADLEVIDHLLSDARDALARREVQSVASDVNELIAKHGLTEEQRVPLALGLLRARVQFLEIARDRILGVVEPVSLEVPPAVTPGAEPLKQVGPRLTEVLPRFLDFMVKDEGWRGQTLHQNKATYRMFGEVCGDRPVTSYTRKDLTDFFDVLRDLPALYAKDKRWRNLSLREIGEQSRALDVERLSMKTLSRHFSALGSLFKYLKRRGEYDGENPAHGFDFPRKGRANRRRQAWEGEKLTKLFASPVWTGCASAARRSQPGKKIIKDEKYWLPILALFHGNRLEEFAQLVRKDIREADGIRYFDVNDDGEKQLKNEQSKRRVPLHPKVIELGFVSYVEGIAPNADDRVFPQLLPGGPDQKLGYSFTKWWSRYRRDIDIYEKGLDYHSFRHGVTTKLYAASVAEAVVDELTGHEGTGTSRTVYKKDLPIRVLYDAICKVEWPEVDL